ncbi:MAG: TonB-dependent receptor, partial [Methylococcaceae bacterium]|nr:TonB-dependent receptor [Methylococcaceae bacterium]
HVQVISAEDLEKAQSLTLPEYMNRYLGSVNINDAQNNPYQPDVQYRGFTASPLLGLPQGLAVYMNGIRFNEPFGDSVNWDLIPAGAIDTMTLQSGSNPAFGLNSLGGALALQTKTGFSAPKHQLEVKGGSWGRHSEELSSGWNNGTVGYFIDANYFKEDGWRDFSNSEVQQALGTFSWRGDRSDLDLTLATADNNLRGNGALPLELLKVDRSAVFTHPDIKHNRMFLASLNGSTDFTDDIKLSGNMYYRRNRMRTYNGDGSEFGGCGGGDKDEKVRGKAAHKFPRTGEDEQDELDRLNEVDDDSANDDGAVDTGGEDGDINTDEEGDTNSHVLCDQEGTQLTDTNKQPIANADNVLGGTINTSESVQRSFGFALQTAFSQQIFKHDNNLVVGWTYDNSSVHYSADSELGALTANRGVNGAGILLDDSRVRLNTATETYGAFFTDTFSLTEQLHLTVAGRYNHSNIKLMDQYGDALNGQHRFERFNPSAGLTYAILPSLTAYGNYSQSTRMPTPMELSCADPNAPCKLPNAFVSDPPLNQVVAETWEAGFRGKLSAIPETTLDWNAGYFQTNSNDDIIFQSAGGVIGNRGFFQNIGKTKRQGLELGLNATVFKRLHLDANYTYLDATVGVDYLSQSPSHPNADALGNVPVKSGSRLPGIPEHLIKLAVNYDIIPDWSLGVNMIYNGDQFLRGDQANLTEPLASYMLFNLKTEYRFNEHFSLFGKLDNIFNKRYQNFGTYGNTGGVLNDALGINDVDTRFVGVGAPRAGWVGIRITL